MILSSQEKEHDTLYSYLLNKQESVSLDSLKELAFSMLSPFKTIEESDNMPSEYTFLKELYTELHIRMQCITNVANIMSNEGNLNCEEITIVDYGCGQGLASLCLLNWLQSQNFNLSCIKQIKLIDKNSVALKRALLHFSVLYPSIDVIAYEQDFMSKDFSIECNSILTINLFSQVLNQNFKLVDHIRDIILKGHNLLMHNVFIEELITTDFPNKYNSIYFKYLLNKVTDTTACHLLYDKKITLSQDDTKRTHLIRTAVLSRTKILECFIPNVNNNFSNLCPGEPCKKFHNVPFSLLYYVRPLENTDYCSNLDDKNMISFEANYVSPDFKDQWKKEADIMNPKTIKFCAEKFYQGHIHHALSCNMPCAKEILNLYQKAAEEGITEAYNNLGVIYYQDAYEDENAKEKSLNFFKLAAKGGSAHAMINLASYYMDNNEVEMAIKYYEAAAEQNNCIALFNLAIAYNFGLLGKTVDINKSEQLYRKCLKVFNEEKEHDFRDINMQNMCCLNLMLLLYNKGEHYLKILDIFALVDKPSKQLNYCYEIITIASTNRFKKDVICTLAPNDSGEINKPYMSYNRAILLYNGLKINKYNINIDPNKELAIEIMRNLVESDNIEWEEKEKWANSQYCLWVKEYRERYWREQAQKDVNACSSLTNLALFCSISEEEKKSILKKYAFGDGCSICDECTNYDSERRACPKAQYKWAKLYETNSDCALNLLSQSANQGYNNALFDMGFYQAIRENIPTFKEDPKYRHYSSKIHIMPPQDYDILLPILAQDCYYTKLQKVAESGNIRVQSILPFIATHRSNKYNFIYWLSVFCSYTYEDRAKHLLINEFNKICNKSIDNYFLPSTLSEKQIISISINITNTTKDTAFLCKLGNYYLEGKELYNAQLLYRLAKDKGCKEVDLILEEIDKKIEEENFLSGKNNNYRAYDEPDYSRDTWDAMTDGMYGDYPGEGVDYETMGF